MNRATFDSTFDSTFGFIAARAACYPVIVKRTQLRTIRKGSARELATGDPGIQWLLLNTQKMNQFLEETGWEHRAQRFLGKIFVSDATNRCLKGTG